MSVLPGWPGANVAPPAALGWGLQLADVVTRITLDDLAFATSQRAVRQQASRGPVIAAADLGGWYQRARDLTPSSASPRGDGVRSGLEQLAARTITIPGWIRGASAADVLEAIDRVSAGGRLFAVDERERRLKREADVRTVDFAPTRVTPTFHRFVLTLQADDALRFSSATQDLANGANTLVNTGDREAFPVLEIPGPHSAITITHGTTVWSFAANSGSTTRVVDLREGEVWQGNVRVFGLESGGVPSVPAGSGATWTIAGLGAGGARARRIGAWR